MKKLGLLVAPVLFALGCGGVDDILNGTDGGVCPAGVTPYQQKTGTYKTLSVTALNDGCALGVTAANLQVDRMVSNDGAGNITVDSVGTTTNTKLGSGPVRCNTGTLTNSISMTGSVTWGNGCVWQANTTIAYTATAANQFTMAVTQSRGNFTQDPTPGAATCKPPTGGSCTVSYTASLQQ